MEINRSDTNEAAILHLSGRLDTITAPKLQEALVDSINGSAGKVILDLEKLAYVSSAGLRVLLLCEKNSKASGKLMELMNVSPDVMEVFQITGFAGILTII